MTKKPSDEAEGRKLDLRGLKCPLPALMVRLALERASAGISFNVLADDPLAHIDIPHMCAREGFDVLSLKRSGTIVRIRLRKNKRVPSARQL